jgi:hypothetical protein
MYGARFPEYGGNISKSIEYSELNQAISNVVVPRGKLFIVVFPPTIQSTSVVILGFTALALLVSPKTIMNDRKVLIRIERFENLFIANSRLSVRPNNTPYQI